MVKKVLLLICLLFLCSCVAISQKGMEQAVDGSTLSSSQEGEAGLCSTKP